MVGLRCGIVVDMQIIAYNDDFDTIDVINHLLQLNINRIRNIQHCLSNVCHFKKRKKRFLKNFQLILHFKSHTYQ